MDNPTFEYRTGSQTIAMSTNMTINAFGTGPMPPVIEAFSHSTAVPPGTCSISNATPSQTKSIARVTTMSGTRVTTISDPVMMPMPTPTPRVMSTAGTPPIIVMRTAAVTEQTAIIDATDRSIPPTITTTAIPAVAKANGRADRARVSKFGAPKLG